MTKGEEACVSLETHYNALLEQLDRRITSSELNSKDAIRLATAAQDKRLDLLNEFRSQSSDEAKKYVTVETQSANDSRISNLQDQVSKIWGGLVVVALVGIANLVKLFFH